MTTATPRHITTVGSVVFRASAGSLAVGVAAVVLAALLAGAPGALGAAIGAAMVVAFFAGGAVVLQVVTKLAPAASLLIALLTYTLKVVLIGMVFVALNRSGSLEETVDAQWLGGTVIACTLVWMATQVVASMRARQPIYDLPSQGEEPSVR